MDSMSFKYDMWYLVEVLMLEDMSVKCVVVIDSSLVRVDVWIVRSSSLQLEGTCSQVQST